MHLLPACHSPSNQLHSPHQNHVRLSPTRASPIPNYSGDNPMSLVDSRYTSDPVTNHASALQQLHTYVLAVTKLRQSLCNYLSWFILWFIACWLMPLSGRTLSFLSSRCLFLRRWRRCWTTPVCHILGDLKTANPKRVRTQCIFKPKM